MAEKKMSVLKMLEGQHAGKTIDFHTHLLPRSWPDPSRRYGYAGFFHMDHDQTHVSRNGFGRLMRDSEVYLELGPECWDLDARLADMDQAGVDVQVVSTIPEMFSYWARADDAADLARIINNDMAREVARHPDRFVGLCTVPLQAPELAVAELQRCISTLNFGGVIVGTHVNGLSLDAPELMPFWEAAEELGTCVFVHPNNLDTKGQSSDATVLPRLVGLSAEICHAAACMLSGGVMDSFPSLRVCFAHGAGTFPYVRSGIEHELAASGHASLKEASENLDPRAYNGRFFVDSIVHGREATDFLIQTLSDELVVFGSDYPYPLGGIAASSSDPKYMVTPKHFAYLSLSTTQKLFQDNGNGEGQNAWRPMGLTQRLALALVGVIVVLTITRVVLFDRALPDVAPGVAGVAPRESSVDAALDPRWRGDSLDRDALEEVDEVPEQADAQVHGKGSEEGRSAAQRGEQLRKQLGSPVAYLQPPSSGATLFEPGSLQWSRTETLRQCFVDPKFFTPVTPYCVVSEEHKLVYFLLPKSGSSTGRHVMRIDFGTQEKLGFSCYKRLRNPAFTSIVSTRNPVSRFYASYDETFVRVLGRPERVPRRYRRFAQPFDGFVYQNYSAMFDNPEGVAKLTHSFENFVFDYDAREPFELHQNLQTPLLYDFKLGDMLPMDEAFDTRDMKEFFLGLGEKVQLPKPPKVIRVPRRRHS
ncbi:2-amino-3-carboxymuconate-6-semialdehyde decarboxylase (Picolinate carboxylase) [Durusdinium trenchii]|uniref:2-amino-3-carboxymuconate-6-semialdehyde decarboxylase n=1 Tax=Durusdinium trenchii TaxID=1381693 RepID=A0ABP0K544_9DINO